MFLKVSIAFTMLCLASGLFAEEISLGQLRAKFEGVVEAEGVEYDTKSKVMRDSYIGALERLKDSLGREGKLEQATHILSEIDGLEESEKIQELPKDADYRFKRLRSTWEHEQRKLDENRSTKLFEFGKVYIRTLDARKKALTREGEIREALVVDEELKRVGELPEVKLVMNPPKPEGDFDVEAEDARLDLYLTGRKYTYELEEPDLDQRTLEFDRRGKAAFSEYAKLILNWRVEEGNKVVLSSSGWLQEIVLVFSRDGKTYKGESTRTKKWRRGSQIERSEYSDGTS